MLGDLADPAAVADPALALIIPRGRVLFFLYHSVLGLKAGE